MDQSPELDPEEIEASDDIPGKMYRHTHSKTEETKSMSTAWRVLHCVLCLLTVVAVWAVALLPSVLTYSINRSPVPVMHVYTYQSIATIWLYKCAWLVVICS